MKGRNEPVCDPLVPLRWTGALTRIARERARGFREGSEGGMRGVILNRGAYKNKVGVSTQLGPDRGT